MGRPVRDGLFVPRKPPAQPEVPSCFSDEQVEKRKLLCGRWRCDQPIAPRPAKEFQNGRAKSIAYDLELQIPHSVCTEIPAPSDLRDGEEGDREDPARAVPAQGSGDNRGGTFVGASLACTMPLYGWSKPPAAGVVISKSLPGKIPFFAPEWTRRS